MNVGLQLVEKLIAGEGDIAQVEPVSKVFFESENAAAWKLIQRHYQKYAKIPSLQLFRESFPEITYRFDERSAENTFDEVIGMAGERVLSMEVSDRIGKAIELHDAGKLADAAQLVGYQPGTALAVPQSAVAGTTDTWEPLSLDAWFSADIVRLEPQIGMRDDGMFLLYPGRTHSVVAETEAGKSWLALYFCAQEVGAGNDVLYIDFEDDADGIVGRLTDLADEDEIRKHFKYIRPWGPMPDDIAARFPDCSLAIVDGITEALTMHGFKSDEEGWTKLDGSLMRPMSATGAAVVSLDHLPKSRENQGQAIGTVHKINSITGASYILQNVQPFGLGKTGYSRLVVRKDRPGYIRKECADGGSREIAAELHIISDDPNIATTVRLRTPKTVTDNKSIAAKQRVSAVRIPEGGLSKDKLSKEAGGNKRDNLDAITELISDGFYADLGSARKSRVVLVKPWQPAF